MTRNVKLLVFPVKDAVKAKAFYSKILGVEPYVDIPITLAITLAILRWGWIQTQGSGQSVTLTSKISRSPSKK